MQATNTSLPDACGLKRVHRHLLQRRALLLRERDARVRAMREAPPAGPGDDAAGLTGQHDLDLKEAERDAREIEAIDTALTRMDNGTYSLCSSCGEPIGYERLAANPHALRCLGCEAAAERAGHGAP